MVKQKLLADLKRVVEDLGFQLTDIVLSIPQNKSFGDYTTNIALQLANQLSSVSRQSSVEIANEIEARIMKRESSQEYIEKVEIAGPGFLNFFIKPEAIIKNLEEILERGGDFGKNSLGKGKKIQIEFISANPTGPLTLANGRGGAVGDSLAMILGWSGYQVEKEYYFNDSGNQVRTLAESVKAAAGLSEPLETHYQGEYVKELAEKFKDQLELPSQELGHKLALYLMDHEIMPALKRFGLSYDEFYSEQSLYQGKIDGALKLLSDKGVTYEKDGALWLKSSEFGDEKDCVLLTSEAARGRREPTYITPDIAHHIDILSRGFDKKINILGADHHGYTKRLLASMEAAGFSNKVEVILLQFVRLFKEGKEVRMSKRAGNFITLDELLEAVGKDVARFFFLMYAPDSHIDFDLDLAKERSNKNPVFYVQYAHARMANIINKLKVKSEKLKVDQENNERRMVDLLKYPSEVVLIRHLSEFPDLVESISKDYQVQRLTTYAIHLADLFHKFYENCPVLQAEGEELKMARIKLVEGSKIVLGNVLNLMGIEAVERM